MKITSIRCKFSSVLLLLGVSACLFSPAAGRAQIATLSVGQTINIEFGIPASSYKGTGVIGNGGTNWFLCYGRSATTNMVQFNIPDEFNNPTTVAYVGGATNNASNNTGAGTLHNTLLDYYSSRNNFPYPFMITNLPAGMYNVVFYNINAAYDSDLTGLIITNADGSTVSNGVVNGQCDVYQFLPGFNYLFFTNVVVSDAGVVPNAIAARYGASTGAQGVMNGLQIQYVGSGDQPFANPIVLAFPAVGAFSSLTPAVYPGQTMTLSEGPSGTGPFRYQWKFHGADLADNGTTITGSQTANLILSNITTNEAGSYTVAITNSNGGVLSDPAIVQVIIPCAVTINMALGLPSSPLPQMPGVIGYGGTNWNCMKNSPTYGALADEFYNPTPVGFIWYYNGRTTGTATPAITFLKSYSYNTTQAPYPFIITNLWPGLYNVAIYGVNAFDNDETIYTITNTITGTSQTLSLTNALNPAGSGGANDFSSFIQYGNYVVFSNVVVSATDPVSPNAIAGTWVNGPDAVQADMNAVQVQYVGPGNPVTMTVQASGGNSVLTWPLSSFFGLQSNTNLADANDWVSVTNQPSGLWTVLMSPYSYPPGWRTNSNPVLGNIHNQVAVPQSASAEFYRLKLQQ